MKKSILAIFAISSLSLFSCSIKQVEYSQRTVTVSGEGTVTVEADTATIRAAVITRAKEVVDASNQNAVKMTEIQKALKANGIQKDSISTEDYSVYQESKYNSKTGENVPGDYRVTNTIKVTLKDVSKIGDTIDLCLKNGANSLSSISYGISNPEIAEKQARTMAIQKAQESANLLAGTSGAQVGKVLKITEVSNSTPRNMLMKSSRAVAAEAYNDAMAPTPIANAKSSISVRIEAVYQLR
ncbi:MAG: SIMPL domain-containing protein [Treponema sp.]|nr:SIMPL domain-containing protein [Candidatus Treponema equifaecale]